MSHAIRHIDYPYRTTERQICANQVQRTADRGGRIEFQPQEEIPGAICRGSRSAPSLEFRPPIRIFSSKCQ